MVEYLAAIHLIERARHHLRHRPGYDDCCIDEENRHGQRGHQLHLPTAVQDPPDDEHVEEESE